MSGLLSRIITLGKAAVGRGLDNVEARNPSAIAKEQIEEAKQELERYRQALITMAANRDSLAQQIAASKADVERWGKDAEAALKAGKEDLARTCLERQATADGAVTALQAQHEAAVSTHDKSQAMYLEKKQVVAQKESVVASAAARETAAKANLRMHELATKVQGTTSSLGAVDKYLSKVTDLENQAAASAKLEDVESGADVERELAKIRQQSSTDDHLAALKARVSGGQPKQG